MVPKNDTTPDAPMTDAAAAASSSAAGSSSQDPPPVKEEEVDDEDDFSQSGDLSGDGGVWKEILRKGEGWQRPENGDEVEMHYKGTLLDGVMFDSSYERNAPFVFKLGDGKVIRGWDIVAKTMAKGEKCKVTLRPEYGYGKQGSPPKIPSNASLVFEMELLSWNSKRDVYGDGTVVKTEVETGDGWERPGKLAEVTCNVTTSIMTDPDTRGKQLDKGKRTFTLGAGTVPEVWEKVVLDMKKGAHVQLVCKAPHIGGPGIDFIPDGTELIEYDIELVSWLKVEDIHNDGSLVKKVLREGDGWERPKEGSLVYASLEFSLYDEATKEAKGDPFLVQKKAKFVVGDGEIVDGLDRAVQTMKGHERALITLAPKHAYATAANLLTDDLKSKGVTADSNILVKMELEEFEKAKDMWSMSFEEKADEMEIRKKKGNELIKVGRVELAKKSYERAVAFFDSPTSELDTDLKKRVNQLLVQCHLNLAVCNNKLKQRGKIVEHCKKALEIEPSNVKALYRRGCAFLEMEDFYAAESDLKYAIQLEPNNTDLRAKYTELKKRRVAQDKKDRKLYANLFARMSQMEEREEGTKKPKSDSGSMDVETEVPTVDAIMNKAEASTEA